MGLGIADPRRAEGPVVSRPTGTLWALLGASAAVLVAVAVLSLTAAEGVEPFGGSVSVLIGLLGGAGLIVAGLTGVVAYGHPEVAAASNAARAAAARRASRRRSSEQWRRLEERAERLARTSDQRPA